MNILFLTLLDFSTVNERGIYTDLMREFVKDGHKLFIISPTEKRKKEKTKLIKKDNVQILKLQIGNTQKTNLIEKGISILTLESKFKKGIKKYYKDVKFDLVLYSTPPITLQKAVEYVKERDNAVTYLLLKDIFPQNAVDLGMMKKSGIDSMIYKYFKRKEEKLYRVSDFIGCMSQANVEFLLKNNPTIPSNKVEVCPNSIELTYKNIDVNIRRKIKDKFNIPNNKTVFIYGGNLGKPQGIDFLIDCIKVNEFNQNSFILIIGSGTEYSKIEYFFNHEKPKNSMLLTQLPRTDYEELANTCDVGLIFLDKRFTIPNFPSRLLSYMQASMPVLAATDKNTDLGKIILEGKFGYWCESNDSGTFNKLLLELCNIDFRKRLGQNARSYLENNYTSKDSYDIIVNHFNS